MATATNGLTMVAPDLGVPKYPSIECLWERDEKSGKLIPGQCAKPEFVIPAVWALYEKIDGANTRVALLPDGRLVFGGRSDNAQVPPRLVAALSAMFSADRMEEVFEGPRDKIVTLFGEGYGPGIQKGGGYRNDVSFRLFDVMYGSLWLEQSSVEDIARKLDIATAPVIGAVPPTMQLESLDRDYLRERSRVSAADGGDPEWIQEGVIARPSRVILDRFGNRVMWKLRWKEMPS